MSTKHSGNFVLARDKEDQERMKNSSLSKDGASVSEVLKLGTASSRKRKVSNCFVNVCFINIY